MGMFNWVDVPEIECPYCEKIIENEEAGWQSKKTGRYNNLSVVNFMEAENFYCNCPHCRKWVEFVRKDNFETEVLKSCFFHVTRED